MPSYNDYQNRIFADRYARKDTSAEVKIGDSVVISMTRKFAKDGDVIESRELGLVVKKNDDESYPLFNVALTDTSKPENEWEVVKGVERHRIEVLIEKTYEDVCTRVAEGVIANEPENTEFSNQVRTAMVNREFIPAGRILAGLGCKDRTLTFFNCYVFPSPHDSRKGISDHWRMLFDTFSLGGGIGWDNSTHRPRGEVVRKVNGRSSGAVSWMEQYSQITGAVEQGGSRRGAAMQALWIWHPDVIELINAKAQREEFKAGNQTISRNKKLLENANISILISDAFMAAVQNNEKWDLVFPQTDHPAYDSKWDGDLDKWLEAEYPINVHKTLPARELWEMIINRAWSSGEPGLLFMERMNKMSNSYYYAKLRCTNPCVTGDTLIHTKHGLLTVNELRTRTTWTQKENDFVALQDVRAAEAIGHHANIFFSSGVKPVYRLQTKEGYYLRCTNNHRVMTVGGWKRADELQEGDLLHIHQGQQGAFGSEGSPELGHVLGWLVADGHITEERVVLDFYDKKKVLADFFAKKTYKIVAGTENNNRDYSITPTYVEAKDKYTFRSERLFRVVREYGVTADNLKSVPTVVQHGTAQTQKAFLAALFTADGTFNDGDDKGASIRLDSTSPTLLEGVQVLLLNFNIASRIYWDRREAGYRKLPDGNGGLKEYWCEAQHTLTISKQNMVVFRDQIDFMLDYKQDALDTYLKRLTRGPYKETFTARFDTLTPDAAEEVFDTKVEYTHAYTTGGLISHNCGEQALPPFAVCNLAHINLAQFVKNTEDAFPTEKGNGNDAFFNKFDIDKFDKVVRMGVRFLDNVTDLNVYHDEKIKSTQTKERRIGLGILGYGELLVRLGLRYGSPEALVFTDMLFHRLAHSSYSASVDLAKERGAFPAFKADRYLKSGFIQTLTKKSPELATSIGVHGVRNVTVNTVAPTGSVGTMLDTTTGIEPYFLPSWVARSRIGSVEEEASILRELHKKFGEKLPSYFVTTADITPEEHVRTQSAAQKWIDSSISKTVNLPHSATKADVARAYTLMYELGCKGGTVYRDGSRDKQVLYYKTEVAEDAPKAETNGSVPIEIVDEYKICNHGDLRPKIDTGLSVTISKSTPVGRLHSTIRMHPKTGKPYDIFLVSGKGDISADVQAMGRLMSVILRWPNGEVIDQETRLEIMRDQLHRIPGRTQVGIGPDKVMSLPDGIAQMLNEYLTGSFPMANVPLGEDQVKEFLEQIPGAHTDPRTLAWVTNTEAVDVEVEKPTDHQDELETTASSLDICPKCGNAAYVQIPGKCPWCTICSHTEC